MTICCISDSHLGYRHRLKRQRLEDYEKAFREGVEHALALNPGLIIMGGDMVHHPRPDPKSMHTLLTTLLKIAEKIPVVICIGNHEIEGYLGTAYTPIFSDLHENIHVLTHERPYTKLEIAGKNIGIYGFQFLRNREMAEGALRGIAKNVREADYNILCIHQGLQGYLDPYEISLPALRDSAKNFDLILLGHMHKHQKIKEVWDLTPAYYMGSTERISFNEWRNENGILIFRNWNFREAEFIPIKSARMLYIKEKLGRKSPEQVNGWIQKAMENNKGKVECLRINLEVELEGDYFALKHEWSEDGFTILDVNVIPVMEEEALSIERMEIDESMVREYFQKSGKSKELEELCLKLYRKYGNLSDQ